MSAPTVGRRRLRLSIRSLMIVVGICALVLAPLGWALRRVEQQRQGMLRAAQEAQRARVLGRRARAEALRAAYLASLEAAGTPDAAGTPVDRGLWAALAVNHPVFRRGETKDLTLEFTLVNDGDRALDPKVAGSRLVVNGEPRPLAGLVARGALDDRSRTLPPHDDLRFTSASGESFGEPGIYRVRWEGERFRSPEIVFRVLPD